MNMSDLKNKRILIFQQRMWGISIGHFLAKKLQEEGCKLAALTFKKTTNDFTVNQKEVKYEYIVSNDDIMAKPKEYLEGDTFSLKEICETLGIDTIWPIISTLRNHVRSYKDKYYYGFKQNVPDEEIIDYVIAVFKYIKYFFDNFNPDIIVAFNFVTLPHIMFNLYAKKRGVKIFGLTDSKIKGYHIFSYNYHNNEGDFWNRIDGLNGGDIETESREKAKNYIKDFRENFKKPSSFDLFEKEADKKISLLKKLKKELFPYKQILYWYLKGRSKNYLKNIGITIDYKPPKIILRDYYCHKKYKKFMEKFSYYPFDKVGKYIYFPLQIQPEATMDVMAPYFNNQIETARQVAMSLPDDYTLVIKEHPAMVGLRPSSYIKKVTRTPNVKFIDYRISSEEVLKKCAMVVSPNSTTIAEAAFLNKPAIQLGDLGTTLKLPNVFKHTDMTILTAKIKDVLRMNLNNNNYERRLENYVAAALDTGFNINYSDIWSKGKTDDLEKLWGVYRREIKKNLINNV